MLLTGASRGIGKTLAIQLSRLGAKSVYTCNIHAHISHESVPMAKHGRGYIQRSGYKTGTGSVIFIIKEPVPVI